MGKKEIQSDNKSETFEDGTLVSNKVNNRKDFLRTIEYYLKNYSISSFDIRLGFKKNSVSIPIVFDGTYKNHQFSGVLSAYCKWVDYEIEYGSIESFFEDVKALENKEIDTIINYLNISIDFPIEGYQLVELNWNDKNTPNEIVQDIENEFEQIQSESELFEFCSNVNNQGTNIPELEEIELSLTSELDKKSFSITWIKN
jgi:hypothetical protein